MPSPRTRSSWEKFRFSVPLIHKFWGFQLQAPSERVTRNPSRTFLTLRSFWPTWARRPGKNGARMEAHAGKLDSARQIRNVASLLSGLSDEQPSMLVPRTSIEGSDERPISSMATSIGASPSFRYVIEKPDSGLVTTMSRSPTNCTPRVTTRLTRLCCRRCPFLAHDAPFGQSPV